MSAIRSCASRREHATSSPSKKKRKHAALDFVRRCITTLTGLLRPGLVVDDTNQHPAIEAIERGDLMQWTLERSVKPQGNVMVAPEIEHAGDRVCLSRSQRRAALPSASGPTPSYRDVGDCYPAPSCSNVVAHSAAVARKGCLIPSIMNSRAEPLCQHIEPTSVPSGTTSGSRGAELDTETVCIDVVAESVQ